MRQTVEMLNAYSQCFAAVHHEKQVKRLKRKADHKIRKQTKKSLLKKVIFI